MEHRFYVYNYSNLYFKHIHLSSQTLLWDIFSDKKLYIIYTSPRATSLPVREQNCRFLWDIFWIMYEISGYSFASGAERLNVEK